MGCAICPKSIATILGPAAPVVTLDSTTSPTKRKLPKERRFSQGHMLGGAPQKRTSADDIACIRYMRGKNLTGPRHRKSHRGKKLGGLVHCSPSGEAPKTKHNKNKIKSKFMFYLRSYFLLQPCDGPLIVMIPTGQWHRSNGFRTGGQSSSGSQLDPGPAGHGRRRPG